MMTDLYHLTVLTSHVRMSPRREVGDASIQELKAWIKRGKEKNKLFPGFEFHYEATGANLVSHIQLKGHRVLSFVVGVDDHAQRLVKDIATELAPYWHAKSLPLPFCTVFFDTEINRAKTEDQLWMGDYERIVAWTWIEKRAEIADKR